MTPFRIVPWSADFLPAIKDLADELTGGRPGRAVVVFPHSRPRRYLTDLYRQSAGAPALLPRMLTGEELRDWLRRAWDAGNVPPRRAGRLDQAALLRRAVSNVARALPGGSPLARLATGRHGLDGPDGMALFFPWGLRLADLMEDCLIRMVDARDLLHAEGEVEPFAAALLGELRRIREEYLNLLSASGFSTPGLDAHMVARWADHALDPPPGLDPQTLILAGFVGLTPSEEKLYRHLWRLGATVCLHTDPGAAQGRGHWSCADHAAWIKRWKAECLVLPAVERRPDLRFFAGYDLHSQLREMQNILTPGADAETPDSPFQGGGRAVALPSADLLMPVLHHMPRKDINISLGYPLERTPLARLLDAILLARESLRPDGRLRRQAVLDVLRHPCTRMLRAAPAGESDENAAPLAPLLRRLERRLRAAGPLVDPAGEAEAVLAAAAPGEAEAGDLLRAFLDAAFHAWADVRTLRDAADRLGRVCALLLEHGGSAWKRFPIDAECLYRLLSHVAPELADNAMADDALPFPLLASLIRDYLAEERVPFEADPLTGLQVLGMLETRLLRFDSVIILDATEDRLPGAPAQDPLLPDSLRGLLGLADTGRRDALAAHTFYRLLAGADRIHLLWQEGIENSQLFDSKKSPSRFVQDLLWRHEKTQGKRLRPGTPPLAAAAFPLAPPPAPGARPIAKSPAIRARLDALLAEPISPSRLDAYLACPARFFHEQVCRVRPPEILAEGDDPPAVGELMHRVLKRAYEPLLGTLVHPDDIAPEALNALFAEELAQSGLGERLPAESLLMLENAGPLRLRRFARSQPAETMPLAVEARHSARMEAAGRDHELIGVFDRVDRRMDGDVVLDYKTGRLPRIAAGLWNDDALWNALENWTPGADDPLPALARAISSVQLPCYLYILGRQRDAENRGGAHNAARNASYNAAWINLAENGEEVFLLDPALPETERARIQNEAVPALIRFLLRHMREAEAFAPQPGKQCAWCGYRRICG